MSVADRRGRPAPFGHVFAVNGRDHFYDVHTNSLLEIEPALAAVLPLYGPRSRRSIVAELAPRFGAGAIREAFAAIERGRRERGLFRARRPRLVPPPARWARAGECDRDLQHLVLTVTEQCNLRCSYCVHGGELAWVRPHGPARMEPDLARRATRWFLDRAHPAQRPVISFYGGEALLEPDLVAGVVAAARAHRRGPDVQFAVDTNGVLLDDHCVDLVVRERMHVQVSLDGPAPEHDRHRRDAGGGATHARIEAGLDRLLARDEGAAARLRFQVTLAPPLDLVAVESYFADFPPFRRRRIERRPLLGVNLADLRGRSWPATATQVQALADGLAQAQERYLAALAAGCRHEAGPVAAALCEPALIRWHHRNRRSLRGGWIPGGNCLPGRRKLHVMPDGTFHPCERTGRVMAIGDLRSGIDPGLVWRLQERFHDGLENRCRECWALRLCGLCFAATASGAGTGTGQQPSEAMCAGLRQGQERTLALVARVLCLPDERKAWLSATSVT